MRKKHSLIRRVTFFLFGILIFFLFYRSGVFVQRIISESILVIKQQTPQAFLPDVTPCMPQQGRLTLEERQLHNYRSMGVICKK